MTVDQWHSVETLFETLSELTPEERAAQLAGIVDEDVRKELSSLLQHAGMDDTLNEPVRAMAWLMQTPALDDGTASGYQQIGPYRLVRRIGKGGMGAVYEAMRVDGFQKRVAIKIIQREIDSELARSKFQQERQLLAALEHPYIARLLDGGEAEGGSPYLVLEYVEGEPIHLHCARLERPARLRLFLKVCAAVEYAHRNLIVHRDLKPANIMVTADGDPKLLDFGIAKLLDPDTALTQTLFALTPDYASPEQIRGLPISTGSDVYSLGVVLYEILTGRRPYRFTTTTPLEMDRVICVEPPEFPGLGDELDYILLMALRKEPERRYGSVRQLAEDIERYLDSRPVLARPDTPVYRTRKYVRRHWVGLVAASIAMAGVCVGAGVAFYQARIAQQRFNDVRQLANWFIFDFDKEIASVPGNTRARQMLAATARKYLDNLATTAGNDEGLLVELATSYEKLGDVQGMPGLSNLGLTQDAAKSYEKATSILDRLSQKNPKYRARLATDLGFSGRIAGELNQSNRAIELASRAAVLSDQLRAESPTDKTLLKNAARSYDVLSSIQQGIYRSEEAAESSRKAVTDYEQLLPASGPPKSFHSLALAVSRSGLALRNLGDLDAAEAVVHRALNIENKILRANPSDLPSRVFVGNIYGDLAGLAYSERYPNRGNLDAAVNYWQEALRIYGELAAGDANDIRAQVLWDTGAANLALIYGRRKAAGDAASAERYSQRAINNLEAVLHKAPNSGLAMSRVPLVGFVRALVLAQQGQYGEALYQSQRALAAENDFVKKSNATVDNRLDFAGQLLHHAEVLIQCKEYAAARQARQEAGALLSGLAPELRRWISYSYQAGAYRFGLAKAMEQHGREFSDNQMLSDATAEYAEAARLWSPWLEGRPYMRQRVAEASAGTSRCLAPQNTRALL